MPGLSGRTVSIEILTPLSSLFGCLDLESLRLFLCAGALGGTILCPLKVAAIISRDVLRCSVETRDCAGEGVTVVVATLSWARSGV